MIGTLLALLIFCVMGCVVVLGAVVIAVTGDDEDD
jgi:hypothetical protein